MSKLAMNEVTTFRWSLLDDVTAYRNAGYAAIGVWRPKLAEFGEERGVELIRDSGLAVSSISWTGGFTGANGFSFNDAVQDARDAIGIAARLRADCVVVVSGARCLHTANHARRLLTDALLKLADLGAEHGVALAVQPMHEMFADEWTFLTTLDATLDVLDRCGHPWLKMAFDVYHLWREPRLLNRIPQFASRVATVRLNDWREPPRSDHDRCLPGDGEIPLAEIVQSFEESGYDGYFEIEIWSDELWNADYGELLSDCRDRCQAICRPV